MIIPPKFEARVLRHFIAASVRDQHPLIMAIQGAPGSGKSFQLWHVLLRAGIVPIHNAAVALSGGYEGDSAAELKDLILRGTRTTKPAAIVINDLDLSSAGQVMNATYTVNSQLLVGALMDYCDQANLMRKKSDGYRVPIFVTGNNLNRLPKPLTRPSRMDIYTWEPSPDEVSRIVHQMYYDGGFQMDLSELSEHACASTWTIAAYAGALSHLVADRLYADQLSRGTLDLSAASALAKSATKQILTIQALDDALKAMESPRNHLEGGGA